MPWLLVPFLPALLVSVQIFPGVSLYPTYLLIPLAGILARKFGVAGLMSVAFGCCLALGPVVSFSSISFGGGLSLYLIALAVGWAALHEQPLAALTRVEGLWRSPVWFCVLLLLLPLAINIPLSDPGDEIRAFFVISLLPVLVFSLFNFGLAGLSARLAITGLMIAAAIGIGLAAARADAAIGWLGGDSDFLLYRLDDLAILATSIAAFYAGRDLASPSHPGNPWRYLYVMVAGLTLLGVRPSLADLLLPATLTTVGYFGIHGDYLALPLAAFMAGAKRGFAGMGFVLGLTIALLLAGNLGSYFLAPSGIWLEIEQPLLALAFGYLGIRCADAMSGQRRPWPGARWYLYAGLVLLFLPALFSLEQLLDLVLPFATAIAAALFAALVLKVRQRLALSGITLTGENWLKLAAILGVLAWGILNLGTMFTAVLDLGWQYDVPPEITLPAFIVLLHVPLAWMARVVAGIAPKLACDIASIIRHWRAG